MYHKACDIDQQAFIKSLYSITPFTQIYWFCGNQQEKLLGSYILVSSKKIFDLLKDTKNCPCPLTKYSAKSEKVGKDCADQEWPANL